jgi:integrase
MKANSKVSYNVVHNFKGIELGPDDTALIQIMIRYQQKRKFISTGISVKKSQWKDGKVVRHTLAMDYNIIINQKLSELQQLESYYRHNKKEFDLSIFDAEKQAKQDKNSLIDFITASKDSRKDIGTGTKDHHEVLIEKLKTFGKIKQFSDLTYDNIVAFDNWLIEQRLKVDTVRNQHKILKAYINRAVNADKFEISNNPYLKFKVKRGQGGDRKYLTAEELVKITNVTLEGTMSVVRDLFLFTCYTGLNYGDAAALTPNDIHEEKGEKWVQIRREKTDIKATIMLLPEAIEIIDKYKGVIVGKLLPYIANQNMNLYLKAIRGMAGIEIPLTVRVSRHTFATTVTLLNGVSLEALSTMLGHTSIKTTQIYGKVVKQRIQKEMSQLREKMREDKAAKDSKTLG